MVYQASSATATKSGCAIVLKFQNEDLTKTVRQKIKVKASATDEQLYQTATLVSPLLINPLTEVIKSLEFLITE